MTISDVQSGGDLVFATDVKSAKVEELTHDPQVAVTMQNDHQFLAISGQGMLINDKEKIQQHFQPGWRAWFAEGRDDPNIRLLKIAAERAEYWDYSEMQGLSFLFEAGKALIENDPVDLAKQVDHGRLRL
ncbi:MAG: pyridoxamine 5'-phosphate oxidase family protein [Xanthomonadales bacterium]|nr:pyridoxamine 5'-phosphate oxidase family protein [Xanthomonadales bacterium]